MPSLTTIILDYSYAGVSYDVDNSTAWPRNPFPSIKYVHIENIDMGEAASLLSKMTSGSLVNVSVRSPYNTCSLRASEVISAIALAEHGTHNLENLRIGHTDEDEYSPTDSYVKQGDLLTIADLRPLYKFSSLNHLFIDVVCKMILHNQDLIELAEALPCLRSLSLNCSFGWQTRPEITFYGIFWLLHLCPELGNFGIVFDAEDLSSLDVGPDASTQYRLPPPSPPRDHSPLMLFVGDSTIADPYKVADVLSGIFHGLEGVSTSSRHNTLPDDVQWIKNRRWHSRRWQKVESLLKMRNYQKFKNFKSRAQRAKKDTKSRYSLEEGAYKHLAAYDDTSDGSSTSDEDDLEDDPDPWSEDEDGSDFVTDDSSSESDGDLGSYDSSADNGSGSDGQIHVYMKGKGSDDEDSDCEDSDYEESDDEDSDDEDSDDEDSGDEDTGDQITSEET
ncbi:hypothetical protein CONPUDRAFT_164547 [Coniophora puteana RWD-64-598 SS2]|uniref:Uncharacterized protein n=1 Tax=Coniophora puteana (strain RWD-64-598) TaxID=741705 RepID=A0A5M3MRQ0_CONPW|nr:uncharacterized protein CONPUDRAFT_164547 [Coniophora puteana RWD-64-598 SS2]EIW81770.1 hypothetical protein CONPUDRAFT_164547 [Coniophora puteana RWD-64-598 SS2]